MEAGGAFFRLDGKTAFITGAASGIGRSIASVFARAGAEVWIADIQTEKAEEAREAIERAGGRARVAECDVTRPESVDAAAERAWSESGRIGILVNNAGIGFVGDIERTPEEDFGRVMDVNVRGVYLVSKAFIPRMIEAGGGLIINMASIASTIAVKERFAYCASKGAVMMMTKSVAMDYVDKGIRCNCICPTRIHTPFVDEYLKKNYPGREAEMLKSLAAYQPLGRMGRPEEVAHLALYIASDEASFHTGEAFPIAGGKLMG